MILTVGDLKDIKREIEVITKLLRDIDIDANITLNSMLEDLNLNIDKRTFILSVSNDPNYSEILGKENTLFSIEDNDLSDLYGMNKYFRYGCENECNNFIKALLNYVVVYNGYEIMDSKILYPVLDNVAIEERIDLIFDMKEYDMDTFVELLVKDVCEYGYRMKEHLLKDLAIDYPNEEIKFLSVTVYPEGIVVDYTCDSIKNKSLEYLNILLEHL